MKFLHRDVFRGSGLLLLAGVLTILPTACNHGGNRAQEKKARDESKRMLDAMHKDADAEIRKYTSGQMQAGQAAGKEKKR